MTTETMSVTRRDVAAAVRAAFGSEPASREALLAAAKAAAARDEVMTVLEDLPERRYSRLPDLWPMLPDLPVGA